MKSLQICNQEGAEQVSTFAKELSSSVAQKPANTAILKALLHAENFGAQGLIFEELVGKTKIASGVLRAAVQELIEYGLMVSFIPNKKETFYGLTDSGGRVASRLK